MSNTHSSTQIPSYIPLTIFQSHSRSGDDIGILSKTPHDEDRLRKILNCAPTDMSMQVPTNVVPRRDSSEEGDRLLQASPGTDREGVRSSLAVEMEVHDSETELDERVDDFLREQGIEPESEKRRDRWTHFRLIASFFCFGLLNNVLYVIILSAALDLVPPSTPKGIVAFFNIFPALIAKVAWPYITDGHVRYAKRIYACTAASLLGMVTIASFDSVAMRLLGIGIASFSSGLGELTFLQLSTALPSGKLSKIAVGAWSSGTGGAGVAGAALWWILRSLGVTKGLGIASVLPLGFPLVLRFLLPPIARTALIRDPSIGKKENYRPIFTAPEEDAGSDDPESRILDDQSIFGGKSETDDTGLSLAEKIDLAKPLLLRYMLWLFMVYNFEYIINSGIAPVLAFDPPKDGWWRHVFKSVRDFYPFWSLTSPPLPRRLLPIPSMLQGVILILLSLQASKFIFSTEAFKPGAEIASGFSASNGQHWWNSILSWWYNHTNEDVVPVGSDRAITIVFLLICLEGLMGGTAYCMTFYHVGREGDEDDVLDEALQGDSAAATRMKVRKAFRIGAVGAADSLGILFASLISMPVEVALCNAQVKSGREVCRTL